MSASRPTSGFGVVARGIRSRPALIGAPITLVVILGLWEAASRLGLLHPVIVPAPSAVASAIGVLVTAPGFFEHVQITTIETLSGFVIGSLAGLLLAIVMVYVRFIRRVAHPYVVGFQVMPKVTLAPLFITFFGFGLEPKIVMSIAMAFFPLLINTMAGLERVGEHELLLMHSLQASRRQTFLKLAFPTALPYVFAGAKTGLTLSLTGAIVGEFVSATTGLGALVTKFSHNLQVPLMFAAIFAIAVFGLALYGLLEVAEYRIVFWQHVRGEPA